MVIKHISASIVALICICSFNAAYAINKNIYPDGAVAQLVTFYGLRSFASCAGAFIDSRHVVTAAHCIFHPISDKAGKVFVQEPSKDKIDVLNDLNLDSLISVESFTAHPNYEHGVLYDIAVLRLSKEVTLPNNDSDKTLANGNLNAQIKRQTSWDDDQYLAWTTYSAQPYVEYGHGEEIKTYDIKLNTNTAKLYAGNVALRKIRSVNKELLKCGVLSDNVQTLLTSSNEEFDNFIFDIQINDSAPLAAGGDSGHPILGRDQHNENFWFVDGVFHGRFVHENCNNKHYSIDLYTNTYTYAQWIDSVIGKSRQKRESDLVKNDPITFVHDIELSDDEVLIKLNPINRDNGGHHSSAFIGGNNTFNAPTRMIWSGKHTVSRFSIIMSDNENNKYEVNLLAHTETESGNNCGTSAINDAVVCSIGMFNNLLIELDDNANHDVPNDIELNGQFTLNRLQWPHMNTTNIEVHLFNVTINKNTI